MKVNDTTSKGDFDDLDRLSMRHVGEMSPRLWAFLIATYWVSVANLRATALMSPERRSEQFAVLVRDIPVVPKGQTRKEQVDSYLRKMLRLSMMFIVFSLV